MNTKEAVELVLTRDVYKAIKDGKLSPPEILKIAALKCFTYNQNKEASDIIRKALIELNETGLMNDKL